MENNIFIKSINNYKFDFKNNLNKQNCLLVKNCKNLDINISNKVNKLIFINCNNINININKTIIGIEFDNCKNIQLTVSSIVNSFESYKSIIKCKLQDKNKTFFQNEKSKITYL